jgi:hypothetical protein
MIISVHIPKTAGTSFREELAKVFGTRVLWDYGDWTETDTPEAREHDERLRCDMLADIDALAAHYDAIHGHFTARKYLGIFPTTTLVTMLRDPFQQAMSAYAHAERSPLHNPADPHPAHVAFREQRMTAVDLIEMIPNHQSIYLAGLPLEAFAMVGLAENYEQTVALFEALVGVAVPYPRARVNLNMMTEGGEYEIPVDVRRAVERYRAEDLELYRRATERFVTQCAAYGIA